MSLLPAFVHLSLLVLALQSSLICNESGGISLCRLSAQVNRFGDEMTPRGEKTNHVRVARSWTVARPRLSRASPRLSAARFPFFPFRGRKTTPLGLTRSDLR